MRINSNQNTRLEKFIALTIAFFLYIFSLTFYLGQILVNAAVTEWPLPSGKTAAYLPAVSLGEATLCP